MTAHSVLKFDHLITSVRAQVLNCCPDNANEIFYQQDLQLIKSEDWFVRRFLIHNQGNVTDTLPQLIQCLKWRKSNRLYDLLSENYFPDEMYRIGCIFTFEKSKDNHSTLYIRLNRVVKIAELTESIKLFINFLLFKMDREAAGHGFVLVFDCSDALITNCDLEMARHIIVTISKYFPTGLAYALAVDFPWYLRSVWLLARNIIPANRRSMLKFCSKDDLPNYIGHEFLPGYLGGGSKRAYEGWQCVPKNTPDCFEFGQKQLGFDRKKCEKIIEVLKPILDQIN